jgi:hypothetical protein
MLAQSLQESMRVQAQMIDRLAREMRDMYARNASQSQFIPMPPQMQQQPPPTFPRYQPPPPAVAPEPPPPSREEPIVPPPVEAGEGIPRFARDFVEEEEPVQPTVLAEALEAAQGIPDAEQSVAGAEAPPEVLPGVGEEPVEEKKDLRQRLRDFLKRIRERLEQRRTRPKEGEVQPAGAPPPGTPSPRSKAPTKSSAKKDKRSTASASGPSEGSTSLVNYLEELTEYLPEKRKSSFLHSDARLKIEYIKSKLQGRSGIKNQIESKFAPPARGAVKSTVDSAGSDSALDTGKIAETFDFMMNLASYHPDKTLGTMLQSKLNSVLHKIRE